MTEFKFFVNFEHKTMSELATTAAHINREDKTSQNRILPHVPKGNQLILNFLKMEWHLRRDSKIDLCSLCNTVIDETGASYPRKRKGGLEPLFATHFLFQLDKRELEEINPNPKPVLSRIKLEEEYKTKGHELAWESLFRKMNKREVNKLIQDNESAYHNGIEGFISQSYDTAEQEWFGEFARDFQNNKVLYERYLDCHKIIQEIYPNDTFHPKSLFMGWVDLDERGHLKIEFLVCPIVKSEKTAKYSVSVSRAFSNLTEKCELPFFQTKRALLHVTANKLAKRGYIYEEKEPYYGRSAKQDIEAIAAIKIEQSAVQAELKVALQDLRHLKPDEDLQIIKEVSRLSIRLEMEDNGLRRDPFWKSLQDNLKKLKDRAHERDHLIKTHQPLKNPNGRGYSSPSPC